MLERSTLLLLLATFVRFGIADDWVECPRIDGEPGCVCNSTRGVIDLTSLAKEDGTPRFTVAHGEFNYFYNPCYAFSLPDVTSGLCQQGDGMAGCQRNKDNGDTYGLGKIETETIFQNPDETHFYVTYTNGQDKRHTKVHLICNHNSEHTDITTDGDDGHAGDYVFNLTTPFACPGWQRHKPHHASIIGPIGIGIIFFGLLCFILYFIIGGLIMKFKMQATGTDIIPQKRFWFGLPLLIKDGVLFTFSPVIRLIKKDYTPIA